MAQDPSGYDERKRLQRELPNLPKSVRTAVAAAFAERVLPILEDYFDDAAVFREAVDLTWAFALQGNGDEERLQEVVDEIEELSEQLYDHEEIGAKLYALNAVTHALQSAVSPESKLAEDAAADAQGAADLDAGDVGDEYSQEEADWQMLALDIANKTPIPTRDMFNSLPSDSRWLRALRGQP
jgi:hypothetical protein